MSCQVDGRSCFGLSRSPSAAHAWCALRFCACIACYEIQDFLPSFFRGVLRARAEQGVTLVQTTWACECLGGSTWVDVIQQSVALSGQVTSDMQRLRWTLMHYSVMPMMHAIAWAGWCRPPRLHNSGNYNNFWHGGGARKLRSTTTAHNHAT